jgi:hypothetical protein
MPNLRAMVTFDRKTNVPEDRVVNTWAFETTPTADQVATRAAIATALTNFYNGVDTYLSSQITALGKIKFYDLGDPMPRAPKSEHDLTLTTGSGDALPEECAIVLSFSGPPVSGTPQRRRRGRIYLGPLSYTASAQLSQRVRVAQLCLSTIRDAAAGLLAASVASLDWSWIVWAPSHASQTSSSAVPVDRGWVDDAFDTQRRRGPDPTMRLVFPV